MPYWLPARKTSNWNYHINNVEMLFLKLVFKYKFSLNTKKNTKKRRYLLKKEHKNLKRDFSFLNIKKFKRGENGKKMHILQIRTS